MNVKIPPLILLPFLVLIFDASLDFQFLGAAVHGATMLWLVIMLMEWLPGSLEKWGLKWIEKRRLKP
jgi:prepilin signal peptidase PulO-like enzyme (type II secretory pathway)